MQFLDLSVEVFDDSEEDERIEGLDDNEFVDDSNVLRAESSQNIAWLRPDERNESLSAEEIARGIVERTRKRRRLESPQLSGTDEAQDALSIRLRTGKALFADGVEVDDSSYKLYFIRATDPVREIAVATQYFPPHCIAFQFPWVRRRVYYWVPNAEALDSMFTARGHSTTAAQRVRVPDDERGAVFTMLREKFPPYHAGSWVTIKKGKFAGDFAIVEQVLQDVRAVIVATMARIDDTKDGAKDGGNRARPQKRLAELSWLRDMFRTEPITHFEDGTYQFRRGRYRNGLRLLRLAIDSIEPAFPFLHDVEPFHLPHLGDLQGVDTYVQAGDLVCVRDGPLKNLVGLVDERLDTDVVLHRLRRIEPPREDNDRRLSTATADQRENLTTWDYIRQLRRSDILLDLDLTNDEERIQGKAVTHIRTVHRYINVGDEVLVRAGMHSGKHGVVAMQEGEMLSLKFKEDVRFREDESMWHVSRLWVETAFSGLSTVRPVKTTWEEQLWFNTDIIFLRAGKHAGRWARVLDFEKDTHNVFVLIRGLNGEEDVVERRNRENLVKWSIDMVTDPSLPPGTINNIYSRTHKSRFVGKHVYIWRRGDASSATREAKSMYGFVLDVDEERKTARVSYQNKEGIFPLRNLVSGDLLRCLDHDHPLTSSEVGRLFARVSEEQARASRRVSFPQVPSPPPAESTTQPEAGRPMALEPVEDFSAPGSWVFHPAVRTYYPAHKVFVRCRRQERAGYITGNLGEDHSRCIGSHNKCQVRVHIVWGRTISETAIDVSDIEPCRPVKKNKKVLLIGGEEPWAYEPLTAIGVPKAREQPIKVQFPGKNQTVVDIPAARLTKVEKA